MLISNKKYFIAQLNSSKAYTFISMYHYTHRGFKAAKINLGIYDKETNKLVGVLQWGRAAAANIKLDRYVKEPININEYLELNRFAMADSEEKNSESQAISLGIKWIKKNLPEIKLLVSYAGRIEGNYGYIYQATNWEYLGSFISKNFYRIDGDEFHNTTMCVRYGKVKDQYENMDDYLCKTYHNIEKYDCKEFIYIIRLDKKLTPANDILPYPKPSTDYPIQTSIFTVQKDKNYTKEVKEIKEQTFYYIENEPLFSRQYYAAHGLVKVKPRGKHQLVVYNKAGNFESIHNSIADFIKLNPEYNDNSIRIAFKEGKIYKNKVFKWINTGEPYDKKINVPPLCWIDDIAFYKQVEIAKYVGVTRQAVSNCFKRKGKTIGGKEVIWNEIK